MTGRIFGTETLPVSDDPPLTEKEKNIRFTTYNPCTDEKPRLFQLPKWLLRLVDRDAIQFGLRMAVLLTASSLFTLVRAPGHSPEAIWVFITILLVSWFPTLDVASVLAQSLQHLVGTLVGIGLGVVCGLLSLEVEKAYGNRAQAVCVGSCIALVTFFVCCYTAHTRVGQARLIDLKSHGTVLCLWAFTVSLIPFYESLSDKHQLRKAMYREIYMLLGSFLGVGLSMMVFPRTTVTILQDKISKQIELAGEASEAVLHTAADVFAEETYVPLALAEEILRPSPGPRSSVRRRTPTIYRSWRKLDSDYTLDYGHDLVVETFETAMKDYRAAKAQLGMLKYDPFNIGRPNDLLLNFKNEVAQTLARSIRIQATVVLMDGIVRNDPKHKFSKEHLELLANVGTLIRSMLSAPLDVTASDDVEKQLSVNMVAMRQMIVDLSAVVSETPELQIPSIVPQHHGLGGLASLVDVGQQLEDDIGGMTAPTHVQTSHVCSLLFLLLAEHLALRSVRLYQSWKQYDGFCRTAEKMRASVVLGEMLKQTW